MLQENTVTTGFKDLAAIIFIDINFQEPIVINISPIFAKFYQPKTSSKYDISRRF